MREHRSSLLGVIQEDCIRADLVGGGKSEVIALVLLSVVEDDWSRLNLVNLNGLGLARNHVLNLIRHHVPHDDFRWVNLGGFGKSVEGMDLIPVLNSELDGNWNGSIFRNFGGSVQNRLIVTPRNVGVSRLLGNRSTRHRLLLLVENGARLGHSRRSDVLGIHNIGRLQSLRKVIQSNWNLIGGCRNRVSLSCGNNGDIGGLRENGGLDGGRRLGNDLDIGWLLDEVDVGGLSENELSGGIDSFFESEENQDIIFVSEVNRNLDSSALLQISAHILGCSIGIGNPQDDSVWIERVDGKEVIQTASGLCVPRDKIVEGGIGVEVDRSGDLRLIDILLRGKDTDCHCYNLQDFHLYLI